MSKKPAAKAHGYFLHEELIIEILLRLPVKSLLRFRSVSHGWSTIIRSPDFIRDHYHRASDLTGHGMLEDPDTTCSFFCPSGEVGEEPDLALGKISYMSGPCNGIFCVWLANTKKLALWNPATKRLRLVPAADCLPQHVGNRHLGFHIDPSTGDFTVAHLTWRKNECRFAVYKSSRGSWELLEHEAFFGPGFAGRCITRRCSSKGVVYLLGRSTRGDDHILAFDMINDSFNRIEMPPQVIVPGSFIRILDFCGETLALLVVGRSITIWLMKELGCWTKHLPVSLHQKFEITRTIGIWNMHQIFICNDRRQLMIIDTRTATECIVADKVHTGKLFLPYRESLVPV